MWESGNWLRGEGKYQRRWIVWRNADVDEEISEMGERGEAVKKALHLQIRPVQ
jgi:hypothetical protein